MMQREPEEKERERRDWHRRAEKAVPLLAAGLLIFAAFALHRELSTYRPGEVWRAIRSLPTLALMAALVLTFLDYAALTGYDALALRFIGRPLSYGKTALASFVGYAFGHNMGFSFLSGGGARLRVYSAWGISAAEVAGIQSFCGMTFWMGFLAVGGAVLTLEPMALPRSLGLPFHSALPIGVACLLVLGTALGASAFGRESFRVGNYSIPLPRPRTIFAQTILSSVDWGLAAGVLFMLLPAGGLNFPGFLGLFMLAQVSGLVSQMPGGLGVFETALLYLLRPHLSGPEVMGALLAYRGIYYLLPLLTAALLMGAHEAALHGGRRVLRPEKALKSLSPIVSLIPGLLAAAVFLAGMALVLTGVLPVEKERLSVLTSLVPLPVMEVSHFVASLLGVGLLFLARGLARRLDGAYVLTLFFLSGGVALSFLRGLDVEAAILLGVILLAVLPCRKSFYRRSALFGAPLTESWLLAVSMVLGAALWLGFFSHRHIEYDSSLWWQFTLHGSASRFLRSAVGMSVFGLALGLDGLLRPLRLSPAPPTEQDLARADTIVRESPRADSNLALLGDKFLLFSDSGRAFVMYGVSGSSWVAMGDPVGPGEEIPDLAWRFKEAALASGGHPVFYEVGEENLPLYRDMGMTVLKIGEEARVPLGLFSLEGSAYKDFRAAKRKMEEREGCRFSILAPEEAKRRLEELRAVSREWLQEKNTREKGFSLGFFRDEAVTRGPVAVVECGGGLVAFASLWFSAGKEELSPDLMRYGKGAPRDVMSYLFGETMSWGKEQGFSWFSLGMAPLSGLDGEAGKIWPRAGSFLFRHGEHFYNFQGLRHYKEKFNPVWQPRYLVASGTLYLPGVMADLAALISGGFAGLFGK
jgi:phosphatidylglycerol lysyltransferase